ncbi:galactokinase [Dermabacter vaginalis]|uniref:GHMP family kinase ATP-binding protein n=1 Tax=Dermabacter vaginalis TaxID=1630135 RepID=UPI0021A5DA47|nr:galactokinase family protein [Dermabacter vaginalis]MCT2150400.1 galactokinase [Dermabacter vaginalis]
MRGWRVPGRIEVLGKHTDYAGGQVLVSAVGRAVTVRGQQKSDASSPFSIRTSLNGERAELVPLRDPRLPNGHWGHYVQTVLDRLTTNFGPLASAELTIESDLPPASGMSSSSAVLTAVALTLADLNDLPSREEWQRTIANRVDLAGYAASIENGKRFKNFAGLTGVGTSGGSLDHTGMLATTEGSLSHVVFDPPTVLGTASLPGDLTFVVAVSGVLAEKTGAAREAYNRGPAALGAVLEAWNAHTGREDSSLHRVVRELTGVTDPAQPVERSSRELDALRRVAPDGYASQRLEQFIEESEVLVPEAAAALNRGDIDAFSSIVLRSQDLAERKLGNQIPETIDLAHFARALGARAASAFGAGFGGSVWALVPRGDAEEFAKQWKRDYEAKYPLREATTLVSDPGSPAERLEF